MNYLETLKHTPPSFTKAVRGLVKHVGIREDFFDKEVLAKLRPELGIDRKSE